MSKVTLRTLARSLGLAEGTVSRALNGYPDISEATRRRVREAADASGYRPSSTARQLARGVCETAVYLMPSGDQLISQPFTGHLLSGLSETLSASGWNLRVEQLGHGDEADAVQHLAASGEVGGMILSRPMKGDRRIQALREAHLPFVVHGRSLDHDDYAWFDVDGHYAFVEAVDHLVALGHARISFVGGPSYYTFVQMRLDGYRDAVAANGLVIDDDLIGMGELSDAGGERVATSLLDTFADRPDDAPTAFLCTTDSQALGALAALRARGLSPGRDVSVIGYDGLPWGRHANPPLTTMAQPQTDAGRRMAEMLLGLVAGGDPKDFQELRRAQLVRRESDGPAPRRVADPATVETSIAKPSNGR